MQYEAMNLLVQPGRFNGDLHFTAVPMTHLALNADALNTVSDWFRCGYLSTFNCKLSTSFLG